MEKMRMESISGTRSNIEKIEAIFPHCVTETKGKDGKTRKAVNFDALRLTLSDDLPETDEAYEFTWVGKRKAMIEARTPIRKTLRPCPEESVNWDSTQNLYIEGDNLEVLKLLQESYLGKVKMIYIDPPYNTGNDFIYRDDFRMSREEYDEETGVFDDDGNRLYKNTETNGRFHSDWCSMIYSRLLLARNLLTDDGLIFISIGNEEVQNLRKIADEVLGEANFRNLIIIRRGAKSLQAQFETWDKLGQGHEYILLYSKCNTYRFPKQTKSLEESKIGTWNNHWRGTDRPTMRYELFGYTPNSGQWRWSRERSLKAIDNYNRMLSETGYDITTITQSVIDSWYYSQQDNDIDLLRLSTSGKPEHYIPPTNETLLNSSWMDLLIGSSSEINQLFEVKIFDTAKLTTTISRMLKFASKDSIVLDFFSGSATTAHAVMQLNAEDGGNRKFIMVQLPEVCAEGSEAQKAGYANICEIGKERIRRAGMKLNPNTKNNEQLLLPIQSNPIQSNPIQSNPIQSNPIQSNPIQSNPIGLDVGFRVLKLADSNMKDVYYTPDEIKQEDIQFQLSNIKEDRTDLDLLFGCLLDWGLPLSYPYFSEEIDGVTVHTYNDGDLLACFAENVPETVIHEIAKRQPLRAVFRDSCFSGSPEKINVFEIFKHYAPQTTVRVI